MRPELVEGRIGGLERMVRSMLEYRSAGRDNDDFVLPEHSLGSRQQSDLRA
jgi:hypothetical protein